MVTLRNPYARFFSAFQYWRHGSKDFPRSTAAPGNISFQRFAHALGDRTDPLHRYAMGIVAGHNDESRWVWYVHFLRQTHWAQQAHENRTIFVCYGEGGSSDSGGTAAEARAVPPTDILVATSQALAHHNITCNLSALRRNPIGQPPVPRRPGSRSRTIANAVAPLWLVNPTINKPRIPAYGSLSIAARNYIHRAYHWDFELHQRHCGSRIT